MIDLKNVEKYKENNRIEAKKALGGLPESIWETYSAFANTLGGVILLGVEEYRDKSFHVVDLPDPCGLIEKFKRSLNDKKKVSTNILSDRDITIENFEGKRFVAINIPKANRFDKPVFIDGNIASGTYRRGGEGDYRCKPDEIESMKRDAERISADSELCKELKITDLSAETLVKYREKVYLVRDASIFTDEELLMRAFKGGKEAKFAVNIASLLMFGKKASINKYFPFFSPVLEKIVDDTTIKYEAENLFELYLTAEKVIMKELSALCMKANEKRMVFEAISEAIANAMIHSDYKSSVSIGIECSEIGLKVTNAGSLRFPKESILGGGMTDRRNEMIARLLAFASIGSGGVKGIYEVWRKKKWQPPQVIESFSPDTVTVILNFGEGKGDISGTDALIDSRKKAIIDYITEKIEVTSSDIASLLGIKHETAQKILHIMVIDDILTLEKIGKIYIYKLRS